MFLKIFILVVSAISIVFNIIDLHTHKIILITYCLILLYDLVMFDPNLTKKKDLNVAATIHSY